MRMLRLESRLVACPLHDRRGRRSQLRESKQGTQPLSVSLAEEPTYLGDADPGIGFLGDRTLDATDNLSWSKAMAQRLKGKVAVVTGASKGIGASIAKHLAAEGAAVVVNYASSKEGAERVVKEIASKGGKAVAVQADVSGQQEIERFFSEAKKAFGKLDILVNNAGVYEFSPLDEVTGEQFHRLFDLNVLGLVLASREAVKYFGS